MLGVGRPYRLWAPERSVEQVAQLAGRGRARAGCVGNEVRAAPGLADDFGDAVGERLSVECLEPAVLEDAERSGRVLGDSDDGRRAVRARVPAEACFAEAGSLREPGDDY